MVWSLLLLRHVQLYLFCTFYSLTHIHTSKSSLTLSHSLQPSSRPSRQPSSRPSNQVFHCLFRRSPLVLLSLWLPLAHTHINTNIVSLSITLSRPPGHPCSLVDSPLNRFVFCFLDLVIFFVGPSSLAHILHVKSSPSFFLLRTHKLMTQPSNRPSNQPSMQPTEQVCVLFRSHWLLSL